MFKKFNIEKFIYFILIFVMIFIPVLKLFSYISFFDNLISIKRVYVLWISVFFLLFSYLYMIFSTKKKIDYIDILIYILIILGGISTIFAINVEKSFFGEAYRHEGLFTILSYYLLFLNVKSMKNKKYKHNIVRLFVIIGIFQSFYAILQSFTNLSFINRYPLVEYMAMGLCSNPNFFGSYMVMQVLLVGFLYVYNPKKIYIYIYILFTFTLYIAESTGPVFSVVITLVFALFILKDKLKSVVKIFVIMLMIFCLADFSLKYVQNNFLDNELIKGYDISADVSTILNISVKKDTDDTLDIATENSSDSEYSVSSSSNSTVNKTDESSIENISNGRLKLWYNTLPLVRKYWLIGCGLDNFKEVYPHEGNIKFDKAHNVYLQIAVTNGVLALVIFLLLLLVIFIKGFKFRNCFITSIYMAFIGYSIQAFFNISVIDVAPYYYILLGLLISEFDYNSNKLG